MTKISTIAPLLQHIGNPCSEASGRTCVASLHLTSGHRYTYTKFENTLVWVLLCFVICQRNIPTAKAESSDRPNIVLIMADDMGFSDPGCYGGEIHTPNLDRLARHGMRFTQFYNCAVCSPTRAALFSGLHPRQGDVISENMITVAQLLRQAGYRTSISGKWNVSCTASSFPLDRGFEEYYGFGDMPSNYFNPVLRDLKFGGFRQPIMDNREPVTEFPEDYYVTDAVNDHAVKMIKRFSKSKDPFFVFVGHLAPHSPLQAKPEDIERYRGKFAEGWDSLRKKRHQRQIEMGLVDPKWQLPEQDPDVSPWAQEEHKEWQDLRMAVYAAMVDRMDQGIGRILQTLRDCEVDQNTIVLFLSDNGGTHEEMRWDQPEITPGGIDTYCFCGPGWAFLQNTPFRRFKMFVHEGGIATPLIVRWPGMTEGGSITHHVGHVIDILPTLAEIAGTTYPDSWQGKPLVPLEGRSLVPLLQGKTCRDHEYLYWYGPHTNAAAVRHREWKLVSEGAGKAWELYDMASDRTETNNLADQLPERTGRLAEAWFAWASRMELDLNQLSK